MLIRDPSTAVGHSKHPECDVDSLLSADCVLLSSVPIAAVQCAASAYISLDTPVVRGKASLALQTRSQLVGGLLSDYQNAAAGVEVAVPLPGGAAVVRLHERRPASGSDEGLLSQGRGALQHRPC